MCVIFRSEIDTHFNHQLSRSQLDIILKRIIWLQDIETTWAKARTKQLLNYIWNLNAANYEA